MDEEDEDEDEDVVENSVDVLSKLNILVDRALSLPGKTSDVFSSSSFSSVLLLFSSSGFSTDFCFGLIMVGL